MKTDETSRAGIIALQPESEIEQAVVSDLYQRLRAVTEAPEHPSRIGNQLVYYSPACHQYEHLDGDLCRNANIGVTPGGQLDPDPGSRCLVIVHDAERADEVGTVEPTESDDDDDMLIIDEGTEVEQGSDELPDQAEVEAGEHIDDPPVSKAKDLLDQMDDEAAGESEDIGPDGLPAPLLGRVTAATGVDNPDYRALQEIALELQEHGVDISANLSTEELLERFEEIHDRNSVTP